MFVRFFHLNTRRSTCSFFFYIANNVVALDRAYVSTTKTKLNYNAVQGTWGYKEGAGYKKKRKKLELRV